MTAPSITLFANNTAPTGPELDNTLLAYAVFTAIPCTVSGTNALTLAQNTNTPTLTQLTNYIQFAAIAVNTNTGAVTVTHPSFGTLPGYKDTLSGPAAFTGGEIVTGNAITIRYDSALNSGNGGYHVYTATAINGGTITGDLTLSGAKLVVLGGSLGVTLASNLLTGNSLTLSALLHTGTSLSLTGPANLASISVAGPATLTNLVATGLSTLTGAIISGPSSLASINVTGPASLTSLGIGATTATLTRMLSATGTLAYTSLVPNNVQDQNLVVAGAQVNDAIMLGLPAIASGAGFTGFCGTIGTVTVRMVNPTATITISAATITVRAVAMGITP